MKIHLVVFDSGYDVRIEEAWFDITQANQHVADYNGETPGPYEVQTIEISDMPLKENNHENPLKSK